MLDFVEHLAPLSKIGFQGYKKTILQDVPATPNLPIDTQGRDSKQQDVEPAWTWHILEGATIPEEQVAIISPSVGKSLCVEKRMIPVQAPAAGEVIVKVAWTGVCGSDVLFSLGPQEGYSGDNHIAGHEGIGHIVQSQDSSLLGKPVAMRYLASYCRCCTHCLQNLPESCEKQTNFPKHYQGTFQQYLTAPATSLMPLPSWVFDANEEPLKEGERPIKPADYTGALCSGAAALRALKNLNPRPGSVVVISGIGGGIGHFAGLLARKLFNVKVIGVDWVQKRERLCLPGWTTSDVFDIFIAAPEAGSESQWESFQQDILTACAKLRGTSIGSRKADGLIVTASSAAAFEKISEYVCSGGSIVCVGVPKTKVVVNIPLTDLIDRGIRIQGGLMGGWEESYEVMEYIRSGQIRPITTEISLDQVPDCMQGFMDCKNVGKMIVRVNEVTA